MAITTIVFDFGNVIGFFSHWRAIHQLARLTDISPEAIRERLFTDELEESYESGRIRTPDLLAHARNLCGFRGSDAEIETAFADMFWPNEVVCRLVPALKQRYRLFLLSNTNDMHCRWFRRQFAGTLAHFDSLFFSHEVGIRKPLAGIYEHALQRMECRPQECVFIDDMPPNIAAAQARGWHGIVYTDNTALHRSFAELKITV
jgi:putative hydrolase of the HAD superfamily